MKPGRRDMFLAWTESLLRTVVEFQRAGAVSVCCNKQCKTHNKSVEYHPQLYYYFYTCLAAFFSRTTCVSWYLKGKTSLDLNEAKDGGVLWWKWRQLDRMQTICTSLQIDNHTDTSLLSFYRLDALPGIQPTVSKHWRQKFIQNCNKSLTITIYPNAHQFIPLSGNSLGQGVYTHVPL